jgi:hypothetical protein
MGRRQNDIAPLSYPLVWHKNGAQLRQFVDLPAASIQLSRVQLNSHPDQI